MIPSEVYLIFLYIIYFIFYFWLCWVFVAAHGLFSSCGEWDHSLLRCAGFSSRWPLLSCCEARAKGTWASVVVARRLSSCGLRALEHRLSSCIRAQLLCGMWDLPRPGLKPVSPALAGGFLTTAAPGKPYCI